MGNIQEDLSSNHKIVVRKVELYQLPKALEIYKSCVALHKKEGFNQWDENYPSLKTIERDVSKNWLFGGFLNDELTALIAITRDEPQEYKAIQWNISSNYVIIHRLGVHENYLRKGIAKQLMIFAEKHSKKEGFLAIKLDTFSLNKGALNFYNKIGYSKVGYVKFPKRTDSNYTCFEKIL